MIVPFLRLLCLLLFYLLYYMLYYILAEACRPRSVSLLPEARAHGRLVCLFVSQCLFVTQLNLSFKSGRF